jgi:ketosteroid isomerase-like protein
MSEENVEIVRRGYEAFAEGDIQTVLRLIELLDPSFRAYDPPEVPEPRVYLGRQGLLEQLQNVDQAFDEVRWEATAFLDVHDSVVVSTRMFGRGKESAAEVSMEVFHVWTIRNRRVTELRTLVTRQQALEAAGLRE